MENNNNPQLLKAMTYLASGFSAVALLLSLNAYFDLIGFIDYFGVDNVFIALMAQFLSLSTAFMVIFFLVLPHIKEKKILAQIFSTSCQILPILPLFFIASGKIHFASLTLLLVYIAFFITNEIAFRNQYYPNGNYRIYKILGGIGFLSVALVIQKTNALSVLLG